VTIPNMIIRPERADDRDGQQMPDDQRNQ